MTASSDLQQPLRAAFWLNTGLAATLFITGIQADSSGLIANGLDNTADAVVYALSYYATTHGTQWKVRAARVSGIMLILLSAGVVADVWRRFISGAEPVSGIMISMTIAAAVINIVCLRVLRGVRHEDVNLRAAWTFSINDFVSNLGVLVAGILVAWLGEAWPDLVAGMAIALVAARGGIEILTDARHSSRG